MHITVVPASPKTGQAAIRALLRDPSNPIVRGYYRDLGKVPAEFKEHPRFEAVQGSVEDAGTLDFSGSDAVVTITPPIYQDIDAIAHAHLVSENVKSAVKKAGSVRRLVLLSSVGAQYDQGTGELLTNHEAEVVLRDAAPEVVIVRASYFMENWAASLETLPSGFFYTTITPVDRPLNMIAVQDIGATLAGEALAAGGGGLEASPHVFELRGPRDYSSLDVQRAFEEATGGRQIELRAVAPDGGLDAFYAAVFPPAVAARFAAMNRSFLEGGILDRDPDPTPEKRYGTTELVDVLRRLVAGQPSFS
ncbi:hypothetical protein VTH06DRAFT_3158 [Thermothelomyces fergusii]